jgi:hypothetical protein
MWARKKNVAQQLRKLRDEECRDLQFLRNFVIVIKLTKGDGLAM